MKSSHTAISTMKGFNHGSWFGVIVNEKPGKQVSLNSYRIITNIADQNALQEKIHNTHKEHFLEKQCNAAMKIYLALSNLEH